MLDFCDLKKKKTTTNASMLCSAAGGRACPMPACDMSGACVAVVCSVMFIHMHTRYVCVHVHTCSYTLRVCVCSGTLGYNVPLWCIFFLSSTTSKLVAVVALGH